MVPPVASPAGQPKRALRLARQLEEEIIAAGWPVGALIGTEAQLLDRLDVGRHVLREAARLLENHQVARMRPGRGGGLVVVEPDVRAVSEAMSIYLESLGVDTDDVFNARQVIDTFAVELAADRIDERHTARLRALLDAERDATEESIRDGSHHRIHAAIAEASANPAVAVFGQALALLGKDHSEFRGRLSGEPARAGAAAAHRAHAAIVESIISGDGRMAAQRMLTHLAALRQELSHRPITGPERAPGRGRPEQAGRQLARRLRRDIAGLGWPVGHNLGSEPELLERYATGRAGLREAVRLLEHHGVVEMRRGPGGGLVVRSPNAAAVQRAAALHLGYRGITSVELFEAREGIEAAVLRLAVERLDGDGRRQLEAATASGADLPPARFGPAAHDFHRVLAGLSGNRTLELFVAILIGITAERMAPDSPVPPRAGRDSRQQIDHAHRRIAEAIASGDTALAQRRLRLHLRALECSIA